ncbi:hypothetical protein BCAR13_530009 [Paraburkholderia caribensis]|nr:hypothetical protein BCAR13_530009 [Paraburkholderia caribensis]
MGPNDTARSRQEIATKRATRWGGLRSEGRSGRCPSEGFMGMLVLSDEFAPMVQEIDAAAARAAGARGRKRVTKSDLERQDAAHGAPTAGRRSTSGTAVPFCPGRERAATGTVQNARYPLQNLRG